ncbi:hypothetical protein AALO_G00105250 [Alosa alosa]|uniref:Synaptonemal complex central element protein 2 n=1 Tax=Alosa alosa TaxID=278164 RepID=A0AAV6GZW5_9TELE|nr:hypothetical protein AALO_G00105250 [Alosa alosa]
MEDYFFESLPSSLQSSPKSRCHNPHQLEDADEGLDTDHETTAEKSALAVGLDDCPDQKISSRIDELEKRVQGVLGQINENRSNDQEMMINFQEKLSSEVSVVCQQMKDHMFSVYEENSQAMEARLTELSQVLQNCSRLLAELQGVSQDLSALNTGLRQAED